MSGEGGEGATQPPEAPAGDGDAAASAPVEHAGGDGAATPGPDERPGLPRRAWASFARRSWRVRATLLALVALLAAVLAAVLGGDGGVRSAGREAAPALADAVPYDGRSPRAPSGARERVLVALPRPPLGELAGARNMSPATQRAYVASLEREARALRSALGARGVRLRNVVSYERVWDGFAATVRTRQLADVASLGVRPQPVRRLYPALSEPVPARAPDAGAAAAGSSRAPDAGAAAAGSSRAPDAGAAAAGSSRAPDAGAAAARRPLIAVLAGGVDSSAVHGLSGGYDAVGRDRDPRPGPDPRGGSRTETSGRALAGVLAAAGARVMPIRVAALQAAPDIPAPEEMATSDTLLGGLEHAVDPNGDGATDDHAAVALVGVNAPYAGFGDAPEAQAARAAAGLGTLVVAGAGQEGAAAPGAGTIGAPAAGADTLAVGALAAPGVARTALTVGGLRVRAAVLAGRPPGAGLRTAGPLDTADLAQLLRPGAEPLQGRLVVVGAGDNPPARAAAAAAGGASAVLLADPGERALPAMPAGRIPVPVLGVTGEAAAAVLRQRAGANADFGRLEPATASAAVPVRLSRFSSRGPAASGAAKPDLVAPAAAAVAAPGGGGMLVAGTAVAAARAALAAARLAALHPDTPARALRTMLSAAADPASLPVAGAGSGLLRPDPALPGLVVRPPRPAQPARFALRDSIDSPLALRLRAPPGQVTPSAFTLAPRRTRTVTVTPAGPPPAGRYALGRLLITGATGALAGSLPWAVGGLPEPVPVGPLELQRRSAGRVRGVRFTVGAFARGDTLGGIGTRVVLAERLELELLQGGRVVRRLTPPGGARELLPAEYAYTLEASVLAGLRGGGAVRFRARARAPRQRRSTAVLSEPFAP